MSEPKDTSIALNVRLKPSESSAHPRAANYTNVAVAQGIAYLVLVSLSQRSWLQLRKPQRKDKRRRRD